MFSIEMTYVCPTMFSNENSYITTVLPVLEFSDLQINTSMAKELRCPTSKFSHPSVWVMNCKFVDFVKLKLFLISVKII